jgi:Carboxypeptidase regulatory-like domain/HEAT repeats
MSTRMSIVLTVGLILVQGIASRAGIQSISGVVTDASGLVIPGAIVSASRATPVATDDVMQRAVRTGPDGRYLLWLWPGRYNVVAKSPGLSKEFTVVDVVGTMGMNFVLRPSPVAADAVSGGTPRRAAADRLVSQFDVVSMRPEGNTDKPANAQRAEMLNEFYELGRDGVAALAIALKDADVFVRRNVCLTLQDLSGSFSSRAHVDIEDALPALISALKDTDSYVRGWCAQSIGNIGPKAAVAIPALIEMLTTGDEGNRCSSAIALYGTGSAAKEALPALRKALGDPSAAVRRFAQRAIDRIEGK